MGRSHSATVLGILQNTDVHDAVALENVRRNLAQHGGVRRLRNVAGREAEPLGVGGPHAQIDRRTGFRQPIERIHHAPHRSDFRLDPRRCFLQPTQIRREDLDFDWIGRQRQIADHIGENAGEFPAHHRELFGEFMAQLSDDFLCGVLAASFELDRKIAPIRFGDEHAQLGAQSPGITLDIRVGAKNRFRLVENVRRLRKARPRRRPVINDETAFVKIRQEIGFKILINENPENGDHAAPQHRQPAMSQRQPNRAFIDANDAREQEAALGLAAGPFLAVAHEPARQRRRERDRQHERGEQ